MAVNMSSSFKKDDRPNNGLEVIAADMSRRPHERRIVVGIVRPIRTVINHEDGTSTPTVKWEHVEVPVNDADAKALWEVLAHSFEERTGNPLPPQSLFDGPGAPDGEVEGQESLPIATPAGDAE